MTQVLRVPPDQITYPEKLQNITVYVCPNPECQSYFGSSTMPDLSEEFTGPKLDDKEKLAQETGSPFRHTRAECPECRVARRMSVQRIPIVVGVRLSSEIIKKHHPYTPPPLPPGYGA